MGKKFQVTDEDGDTIDVELDDDIDIDQLDNHPTPENRLTDEQLAEIEASETELGE